MCMESIVKKESEIDKSEEKNLIQKAINHINKEQFEETIKLCKEILELDPKSEGAFLSWGVSLIRQEKYRDAIEKFQETIKINPKSNSTELKIKLLREFREKEYEKLKDAVYKRRGWTSNGIPTLDKICKLGIDFPKVIDLIK